MIMQILCEELIIFIARNVNEREASVASEEYLSLGLHINLRIITH